jgi:predicted O-linked N-acetylglucosamine transferase (SPINDLY family)
MTAALSNTPNSSHKSPIEAAFDRAMSLQISGLLDLAEPLYRTILRAQPMHAGANYCLGMLLVHLKRAADGSPYLLAAVNNQPQVAEYWLGYLEALLLQGERAIAAETLALARQHGLSGKATDDFAQRLEAAPAATVEADSTQLRDTQPADPARLASTASAVNLPTPPKLSSAAKRRRANAITRQEAAVMALVDTCRFSEALPLAREMTERFPECGAGWKMLGALLWAAGKELEAIEAMRMSVRLLPQDSEAHKNLAVIVNKRQSFEEAEGYLRRALAIDPNSAPAHLILGHNYQLQGRYQEAKEALQTSIALQSDVSGLDPAQSLLLFVLNNDPSVDADTLFAEHLRVGQHIERDERAQAPRSVHDRNPDRRLEIGLVSADMYNHSVGLFVEPMLSAWKDSAKVRVTVYYVNNIDDAVSQRLRSYVSRWHPVLGLTNEELERRIVGDGIDILIDLSGHTAAHRLGTFARKPAPVQASWLGYPTTTGLSTVDYYLADKHFLPPGEFERYFTEKLVYLPAAWPFQPSASAPPVSPLPALAADRITFGSFNRIAKINKESVQLWTRLMHAVPGSRMLIAGVPVDIAERRLIKWFEAEGIIRERLSFHAFETHAAHFALHHQVDIALETMPYSGCTTSNHALWMGVPSLTCIGPTPASRLSAANLGQLGLDEFIAVDAQDFVAKGLKWANDPAALANLRANLRARWQSAPARNGAFVAAGMELALRHMWKRWCAGSLPESFEISAEEAAATAAR